MMNPIIKSMKKRCVAPRMLGKPWSPCEVDLAQALVKGMVVFICVLCCVMGIVLFGFFGWHLYLVKAGARVYRIMHIERRQPPIYAIYRSNKNLYIYRLNIRNKSLLEGIIGAHR